MSDPMMTPFLQAIRRVASEACEAAILAHGAGVFVSQPVVNWADLDCVGAIFCVTDEGDSSFQVLIEEASPDGNEELREFIAQYLGDNHFPGVEVELAW